jgi:Yip1-like protein
MNNLALAGALATAPTSAFNELRERPRFWFPLLAVVLSTAALVYWYYSIVDIEWMKELLYGSNTSMTPEQRAATMGMLTRTTLMWSGVVGSIVGIPVVYVVSALYFLVAAKVTKIPFGFKHWFSLTCWSALPALISAVISAILLATASNAQIAPGVMAPLSLDELIFHRPPGSPGQTMLASLTLQAFISWVLSIIGVRTWSGRSWGFSTVFVLLPGILIYGIWAVIAFK